MEYEPQYQLKRPLPKGSHPTTVWAAQFWAEKLQGAIPQNINAIGLSVDLETPVTTGAGIFSLGLVPFNEDTFEIYGAASFYGRAKFAQVVDAGHFSGGTLRWWMEQGDAARFELVKNQDEAMDYVELMATVLGYMHALNEFLQPRGMLMPLGNSARFDIGILEHTAMALNVVPKNSNGEKQLPWMFWNELDLRQRLLDCRMYAGGNMKNDIRRTGTHHNAVDDAIHQAKQYLGAGLRLKGETERLLENEQQNWGL